MNSKVVQKLAKNRVHLSSGEAKEGVYLKLEPEVLRWFRAQGRGYQSRINQVLLEYVRLSKEESEEGPSSEDRLKLAQELFQRFYPQCFWHMRRDLTITADVLPAVIDGLRRHGGRTGFLEARKLCR